MDLSVAARVKIQTHTASTFTANKSDQWSYRP